MRKSLPLHIVLIAFLGLLVYSNTFNAPFQWDDRYFIAENPAIKDLSYFLEPSKAKGLELYSALKNRYIGYLSFALNYKLHGLDVRGYHAVNLAVHIFNAVLVYFLVLLTFRTPFLSSASLKAYSGHIALFTGLLFVSHPVQTEAVTYVFQRLASLMAFFYLLSLVAYIGSRLSTGKPRRYTLYALSLISAVLAMKTKENAFTLPVVITIYEFLFFPRIYSHNTGARIKAAVPLPLIPFFLTLFIVPLTLMGTGMRIEEITAVTGGDTGSKWVYLLTQFRVGVTYIRLLFLPVNQNIDYDYPVLHSFFDPQVFLSFLFLLSVFGLGIYLFYHSRHKAPELRLAAFGVFWFFITLSVESSVVLIPMIINEYRVYLPSAGAFPAITTGTALLLGRVGNKRVRAFAVLCFILISLVLSYAAYARNSVWKSRISLWEDVVRKSPGKARGYNNLGIASRASGLTDRAIEHFRTALRLKPDYAEAHNNLGNAYWSRGLSGKAIEHYRAALRLKPDAAKVHNNLGAVYASRGLLDRAIEHFQTALRLKPDFAEARNNLDAARRSMRPAGH